jgi:hypothetical protein
MKRSGFTGILRVASFNAESKRKTRKCAVCRTPFEPRNMTHKVCSPECGLKLAELTRVKADRAETRKRLAALKSRADHLKDAQAACNAFIRARDALLPCVSCGRFHTGAYDAGHYRSVGAMPALRFHELNVHRQCVPCNQHKGGNIVEYRLGLIARIGAASVDWLEMDHPAAKYTIEQALAIKAEYKLKLKELQNGAN